MLQQKTKQEVLWQAHQLNLHDGFINFWQAIFAEVLEQLTDDLKILEFGSQNAKFLQFAHLHCKYQKAVGLFLDIDGIPDIEYWGVPKDLPVSYFPESKINMFDEKFNIAFSLEVFSLFSKEKLTEYAKQMYDALTHEGVYYATFGWHSNNPNTAKQKRIREERAKPFFEHSLDEIAEIFNQVGFEVCVKRLSLPYYLVYEKELMHKRFDSIFDMVENYQDYHMIFSFRKYD